METLKKNYFKNLKDKYDDSLSPIKFPTQLSSFGQVQPLTYDPLDVYNYLRYGIAVKENVGDKNQTIELINWSEPERK